jgi:hypothetical protein
MERKILILGEKREKSIHTCDMRRKVFRLSALEMHAGIANIGRQCEITIKINPGHSFQFIFMIRKS